MDQRNEEAHGRMDVLYIHIVLPLALFVMELQVAVGGNHNGAVQ
jgi:hypothetical protein